MSSSRCLPDQVDLVDRVVPDALVDPAGRVVEVEEEEEEVSARADLASPPVHPYHTSYKEPECSSEAC
jgi:hypothetical protein